MLTITESVAAPSSQDAANTVWAVTLVATTFVPVSPVAKAAPLRVMVQSLTKLLVHDTCVDAPFETRSGEAVISTDGSYTATVVESVAPLQLTE